MLGRCSAHFLLLRVKHFGDASGYSDEADENDDDDDDEDDNDDQSREFGGKEDTAVNDEKDGEV